MTAEEFGLFNEFMGQRFGLQFPDHKKEILESRLAPRLRELHIRRYMDYYLLLQYGTNGRSELHNLASLVTNNESFFFRETHQFESLFTHALDELKADSGRDVLRFLCAGCSSGEEPYTLNIFAKENQFRLWGRKVQIEAFDLDQERVAMARAGSYGAGSLRSLDEEKRARYFHVRGPGSWEIKPMFRSGVAFGQGNILDLATYPRPLAYDALFCRNVLIYFGEESLRKAVAHFAQALRPGGFLFLGHSESIIGMTKQFEPVRLGDGIAYRRTTL